MPHRSEVPRDSSDYLLTALVVLVVFAALLWGAATASAVLAGWPPPRPALWAGLLAFAHTGDPSIAWRSPVGAPWAYWTLTAMTVGAAVTPAIFIGRALRSHRETTSQLKSRDGIARREQVAERAGAGPLTKRADILRPSLSKARPCQVGFLLGTSHGVDCWASVEDSVLALGPPRSGKGMSLVVPMILDAPGPVVTTSTRTDTLTTTIEARRREGRPVAVFDPQHLAWAPEFIRPLRWSLTAGCERPETAMLRAETLVPLKNGNGVENGSYWRDQALAVTRCLLHAAALTERTAAQIRRWSHSPAQAKQAITILATNRDAAEGWDSELDAIANTDPRTRDATWGWVANAFAPLADPRLLDAVTPQPGERFDPASFLAAGGTLYLLGKATRALSATTLVAALVEDVVDTARQQAARSPGSRLDPPLALLLDEAANYPLPSLPSLMSEAGGSGLATLAVLQSMSQARHEWGRDAAGAIWETATTKIVLGGGADADDLTNITRLLGERDSIETSRTTNKGPASTTTTTRRRPVLEPAELRQLPRGQALLLAHSAPPIILTLQAWTDRSDALTLARNRKAYESAMREAESA